MPWDAGGVPPRLKRFLATAQPGGGRALIPGCGSGYEVAALTGAGWQVTAIDFSAEAVARARRLLGPEWGARVRHADFFTAELAEGPFDLVYERTFFCAIALSQRAAYISRMRELLRTSGRLAGIFYLADEREGPPYPLSGADERTLFRDAFELVQDEALPETKPLFGANERWREYRRR